eukprot:6224501-Amphidinium_carterae.1
MVGLVPSPLSLITCPVLKVFVEDLEPNGVNVSALKVNSRKNLRHIYQCHAQLQILWLGHLVSAAGGCVVRLCCDYEESGLGKERKRLRARGVDVLFGKPPENDEKMDRSRNQGPVHDEYPILGKKATRKSGLHTTRWQASLHVKRLTVGDEAY